MFNTRVEQIIEKELSKEVYIDNFGGDVSKITGTPMGGDCNPPTKDQNGSALMVYDMGKKGCFFIHALLRFNKDGSYQAAESFITKINAYASGRNIHTSQEKDMLLNYLKNV